jgi:hypothetical protein
MRKISWPRFGRGHPKEGLEEWEMLSQNSDKDHVARTDPSIPGALLVPVTDGRVCAWLEQVD